MSDAATTPPPRPTPATEDPTLHPHAPPHIRVVRQMARGWWLYLVRGLLGIAFGILALLAPGLGLAVILGVLAAWMILDGISTIAHAVAHRTGHGFWLWVDGIVSLIAGAVVLALPLVSAVVLVLVVGAWMAVLGVIRIISAFRLRSVWLGLLGVVSIVVGFWLILQPGLGLLAMIWLTGIQAIVVGVLFFGLAWRLRRIAHDPHQHLVPKAA